MSDTAAEICTQGWELAEPFEPLRDAYGCLLIPAERIRAEEVSVRGRPMAVLVGAVFKLRRSRNLRPHLTEAG